MRKYVAFLRGINISGKNKIDMKELKAMLETNHFLYVSTYLNSGNIVFSTDECNPKTIIMELIKEKFGLDIPVYIIGFDELKEILSNAPTWWNTGDKEKYDNLIFIVSGETPEEICNLVGPVSDGLETIETYKDIIYWTFDRKLYNKCNWWKKTASVGVADKLTIRTANTIQKICK